jgi:hypothetical protein
MRYLLLDESGDLGVSFDAGSSKFFVMTIIATRDLRSVGKITRNVRIGLMKKYRKVGSLHAYKEEPITRRRVLSKFIRTDSKVFSILIDKSLFVESLKISKIRFYFALAKILLSRVISRDIYMRDGQTILKASRRETNKALNRSFVETLEAFVKREYKFDLDIEIVSPIEERSLQIVDFISWSILRKYELNDSSYFEIIESVVVDLLELDINNKALSALRAALR